MPNIRFSYTKGISAALICCFLLVSVLACAPAPPSPPPPPPERSATLVVEPASGKAAAAIKIKGSNFLPDEEVEIVLTVGDIHHGLGTEKVDKIIADKAGAFVVDSGIPVKTPPGTYTIKAKGNKGSVGTFSITVVP